ncbi:transmembrane protein 61-like [Leucoraja erinacea]|uniref:transmembrane protein 61-like n=1 Tax=Leucoraja erinaceus TaxID=7782 RepID=UPI002455C61A|nr:transmembrane protein 61-like [Leucoraja erinacea]XP_055497569.1 transmembrane protein 61-like [Leucoraja erinacea]
MAYTHKRNKLTIGGGVLLMSGAICFAWWSEKEPHPTISPETSINEHAESNIPPSTLCLFLRLISVLFCLIGGFLLFSGLLLSGKFNRQMSRRDRQINRPTSFDNSMEWRAMYLHRASLYNQALDSRSVMVMPSNSRLIPVAPKDLDLPPSYEMVSEIGRVQLLPCTHTLSDSALPQREPTQTVQKEERWSGSRTSDTNNTPPPSYNNLDLHV